MKQKISFATVTFLLSLMLIASGSASAQHLVSTKAGFVNRADGVVYILRHDSEEGKAGRASLGTQMRDGDQLSTDANSRAEILLNPGSYLRLDENSEVRAVNTSFSETRFELLKGSIIAEVGQVDKKTPIEILTPHGPLALAKEGLVRIDAEAGVTVVQVRQGEIYLGTRAVAFANEGKAKVKRGKQVRLTGSTERPVLAKLDKDAMDSFDVWSFNRAQTLVAANQSSLRQNGFLSSGWFYNSFYGCYSFVPGRRSIYSPYGFGFFSNWADCYWYNPWYGGRSYYPTGGTVVPSLPARVITGVNREPMRREVPTSRGIDSGFSSFGGDFGGRSVGSVSSPSSSPSSSSSISAPAPSRSTGGGGGGAMPSRGNN